MDIIELMVTCGNCKHIFEASITALEYRTDNCNTHPTISIDVDCPKCFKTIEQDLRTIYY